MDINPFDAPFQTTGYLTGILAGLIYVRRFRSYFLRMLILVVGCSLSEHYLLQSVDWNFTHPFDPNDGGPRTFASVFGWLYALIWPIGPTFIAVLTARWIFSRLFQKQNSAEQGAAANP